MTDPSPDSRTPRAPGANASDLADFFGVLAARFANERREVASTARTPVVKRSPLRPARPAKPRSPRTLVWLSAALAGLLLIAGATLHTWGSSAPLPEAVLGSWSTTAAGYRDRGFSLSPDTLVLKAGAGGQEVSSYPIRRVSASRKGTETLYNIEYLVDGAPVEFPLRYSPGPPAEIHLAHQVEIAWTKGGS